MRRTQAKWITAAVMVGLPAIGAAEAHASDGTWQQLVNGSATGTWSDANTASWSGGIVANGSGATADFSQQNITVASTVHLASPRTIGNIIFGDTDNTTVSATGWVLDNNLSSANVLTLAGTPTITVNALAASSLALISANIAGTEGFTKAGTGILSLSGTNTISGTISVAAGTLRATTSGSLGSTTVSVGSAGKLQLQNSITLNNAINLNGTTALDLSTGNNILSGTVTLQSNSTAVMNSTANSSIEMSGTLSMSTFSLSTSGSRPLTISGVINGSGILNANGGDGSLLVVTNNNTGYSGQVQMQRGAIAVGNDGAFGSGTFRMGINDQQSIIRSVDTTAHTIGNVFSMTGSANSTYTFGSATASVNGDLNFTNSTAIAISGVIRKLQVYNRTTLNAGFTGTSTGITMQTGTGTLILTGASSYTGPTTLNAGTLIVGVNGSGSLGNTPVSVNTGATLGGSGSIGGSVTVNAGTLNPGNNIGNPVGTLSTGALTMSGAATLQLDVDTTGNVADKLVVSNGSSATALGTGSSLNFSFGGYVGAYNQTFTLIDNTGSGALTGTFANLPAPTGSIVTFDNGQGLAYQLDYGGGTGNDLTVTFTSVPEPAGLSLLGVGALTMLKRRRHK